MEGRWGGKKVPRRADRCPTLSSSITQILPSTDITEKDSFQLLEVAFECQRARKKLEPGRAGDKRGGGASRPACAAVSCNYSGVPIDN